MTDFSPLIKADARLANANGLMQIVYFFYENAEGSDWIAMKDGLGALLNALSVELREAERIVAIAAMPSSQEKGRVN